MGIDKNIKIIPQDYHVTALEKKLNKNSLMVSKKNLVNHT